MKLNQIFKTVSADLKQAMENLSARPYDTKVFLALYLFPVIETAKITRKALTHN